MGAEAVREHGHVESLEVGPELVVGEVVVDVQVDQPAASQVVDVRGEAGVVVAHPGCHDVGVHVYAQDGVRHVGQRSDHGVEVRDGVHVGAQALGVQAHHERRSRGSRALDPGLWHHVGVGQDGGCATPACGDRVGRASGECDDVVGCVDEHRELGVVGVGRGVVRVAQVVDSEHQRLVVLAQGRDDVAQVLRGERVEAEVHVHDVELGGVGTNPLGGEHARGPPRRVEGVARRRVGEPADRSGARAGPGDGGQVPDVDVTGRDGSHNDAQDILQGKASSVRQRSPTGQLAHVLTGSWLLTST